MLLLVCVRASSSRPTAENAEVQQQATSSKEVEKSAKDKEHRAV